MLNAKIVFTALPCLGAISIIDSTLAMKVDVLNKAFKIVTRVFLAKSLQKTCLYVHEKLQRNPSVGSGLKIFIFRPYGFDYLGFLTNARRGAMRSKTQWVFYRDLD